MAINIQHHTYLRAHCDMSIYFTILWLVSLQIHQNLNTSHRYSKNYIGFQSNNAIDYKLCLLTYKTLQIQQPTYLYNSLSFPSHSLSTRSSDSSVLSIFQCSASLCPTCQLRFRLSGVLDRPVQQSGIPYHFQLLPAPPFILSRNSLRLTCLPQPSPLVELSSMHL